MEINEKKFNEGYKHIDSNLNEQEKKFQEMKKKKKRGNYKNIKKEEGISNTDSMNLNNIHDMDKIKGRSDKIDFVLNDFMKKFHYIYLHSKIFEAPIENLNEILEKVFLHKIDKYYYYQDQIKQFELMKDDDEQDNNEHDEEIQDFLKNLKNERNSYYIVLENLIKITCNKIKKICEEAQIEDDKNVKKYLDELMNSISKIFI